MSTKKIEPKQNQTDTNPSSDHNRDQATHQITDQTLKSGSHSRTEDQLPSIPRIKPMETTTGHEPTVGLNDATELAVPLGSRAPRTQAATQTATQTEGAPTMVGTTTGPGTWTGSGSGSGGWQGSGYDPLAPQLTIEESHEGADERWLVSYADMMTLLFGLFVMLFSLSSQYRGDLDRAVQQISKKTFGAVQGGAYTGGTDIVPDEIEGLRTKLETTLAELSEYKAREEREKSKKDSAQLISSLEDEIKKLKKQLEESRSAAGDKSGAEALGRLHRAEAQLESLKNENSKLTKDLAKAKSDLDSRTGKGAGSFLALVIHWETKNHDVDLVVEDPQGKKFDFKHRSFSDHPGSFTLDTRRGPGAEIWQTDRIIPGTYKVTYTFYSQYGNTEPAVVLGTLSSVKGKKELPPVKLDFASKKHFSMKFTVDKEGNVTTSAGD